MAESERTFEIEGSKTMTDVTAQRRLDYNASQHFGCSFCGDFADGGVGTIGDYATVAVCLSCAKQTPDERRILMQTHILDLKSTIKHLEKLLRADVHLGCLVKSRRNGDARWIIAPASR
jgi:hypothetical protein